MENPEKYEFENRCDCRKFLTKSVILISNNGLDKDEFIRLRGGIVIRYGSETKCRRCKKVKIILRLAETPAA